jgi:LacI family transcriptional regulator
MGKKITIMDIANEAGVSKTAASFYLNGKAKQFNLSDAACARIEAAIKKYNYTPNFHAKAINSGKTFLAGLVVENINMSFWNDIIAGIEEEAEKYQYHILLTVSRYNQEREKKLLEFLDSKGVDGYIHAPVLDKNGVPASLGLIRTLAKRKPFVSIINPAPGFPSVYNDNYTGGKKAAEYLLSKGHRRAACVGHVGSLRRRAAGFRDTLRERGLDAVFFESVDSFIESARQFTSVFCITDYIMVEILGKLKTAGLNVPGDISVIGYDNMDFVRYISPAPSTVSQHKTELGRAAGRLLMSLIHSEKTESDQIILTPELVEGKTVKELRVKS